MNSTQKKYFDQRKNRYKERLLINPPQHVSEETNYIIKQLKERNCKHVVDFGCGNGRLTIRLLQENITVLAVDISRKSLSSLLRCVAKLGLKGKHLAVSAEIPHRKWHAIVGCDILHHVPLSKTLVEIRTCLHNRKGIIVFSEPNMFNLAWTIFVSLNRSWDVEKGMFQCTYFNLKKVMENTHFKDISFHGYGLFPPVFLNAVPLLQKINYALGDLPLLKLFAYRYIITARAD